ncbi:hypothetical protein CVT24_010847 [Panaeolus cyanescens]|uniref:Glucanase n=1 Tax=Panaeolus cyanescens TaxID=181874 RepID=A0A409YYL4_9AGAR|nr:hypothetical protein CVT24_010847 [Panaeolus cyanescens]
MKFLSFLACTLALAPVAFSAPPKTDANPYVGKSVFANKGYAAKLEETIKYFNEQGDSLNAARTRTIQRTPTFSWISASADVSNIKTLIKDATAAQGFGFLSKPQLVQIVVYNLPDRDCSAKASDGEFNLDNDGLNKYKAFIDSIAKELNTPAAKKLSFSLVLEPDSLGNVVTNLSVEKCAKAAPAYKEGIAYAIAKLQFPNVALYIDAANGGWLGWNDNLAPSANLFAEVLKLAQAIRPGAKVRGLATNVSNYNQFIAPVRENFTESEWNNSWDETHYVAELVPHLEAAGFPTHFIVDQSRSGRAGIRQEWGQWCNVRNAGFGTRPTTDQAVIQNAAVDALVWVKPGGESDGTSDESAARFDVVCRSPVAHVPAPEAGSWFNDYVVNLVKNANPPLAPTCAYLLEDSTVALLVVFKMKFLSLLACTLALAPVAFSAPSKTDANPYVGKTVFANKGYAAKLEETIQYFNKQKDFLNAARTRTIQRTPTFSWISASADVSSIKTLIKDATAAQGFGFLSKPQLVQIVVYNLPDRDCSAKASDGEFHLDNDGFNKYKAFIDSIAKELNAPAAKKLSFSLVLEPDSLGNLVTNLGVEKCAKAATAYKEGIAYAIAKLQFPNVALYIDAAHGGWLGWNDNLAPSANLFAEVLQLAQAIRPGAKVRGLATNVSNYNQFIAPVRENFTEWNNSWDETHYVTELVPHLEAAGFPAHFIIDQGRAGQAGIRQEWSQWCNVKNAGFGTRPTADQAVIQNAAVDALVWVKPGGESDGTSDESAARFDVVCKSPVAHVPAPEAGSWFNDYVVNLVKYANPPLAPTWF